MTPGQRVEASPNWQYLRFDVPNEQWTSFASGNGVLDGTWGVLESLMIYQVPGTPSSYVLYVDEIHQEPPHTPLGRPLRPTYLAGKPRGPSSTTFIWRGGQAQHGTLLVIAFIAAPHRRDSSSRQPRGAGDYAHLHRHVHGEKHALPVCHCCGSLRL